MSRRCSLVHPHLGDPGHDEDFTSNRSVRVRGGKGLGSVARFAFSPAYRTPTRHLRPTAPGQTEGRHSNQHRRDQVGVAGFAFTFIRLTNYERVARYS